MVDHKGFAVALQDALNHMDDRAALEHSPLLTTLALEDAEDPGKALQQTLWDAIQSIQPACPTDASSPNHRRYEVLKGRYIERLTQNAVANRLGLGTRQLRRIQDDAVAWLSTYLTMQFDLLAERGPKTRVRRASRRPAATQADINQEMLWLVESSRERASDVATAIRGATDLARPLAERRDVHLALCCETPCLPAAVPETVLRQILLNLISAMVAGLPGGSMVTVATLHAQDQARASITASPAEAGPSYLHGIQGDSVEMARRLAELFQGEVALSEVGGVIVATITVPIVQREFTVLAVEDNRDTLRLWHRFLHQTVFHLVEAPDPSLAVALTARLLPDVVVLDIMLGGVDGWDLLRQLQRHPATSATPVVICSVLPQQSLAESLGATGFIRKPVTGRDFRAALASQTGGAAR